MASTNTRDRPTARRARRWAAPLTTGALDEMWLRRLVGPTTVAAARSCAQEGDVLQHEWDPGGARVVGIVRGPDGSTLQATAEVISSQDGRIVYRFDGRCTCPVAKNCFHSLALLLAPERTGRPKAAPERPGGGQPPGPPAALPGALLTLMEPACGPGVSGVSGVANDVGAGAGTGEGSLGLQFELVADAEPAGRGSGIRRAGPRIRLRPVRRSPAGNWVRTGIDWSNLDYLGWDVRSRAEHFDEQLALLRELSALSGLGAAWRGYTSYAGYGRSGSGTVWLESFGSRRLWDALADADRAGLALVGTGRAAAGVTVEPPAALAVDCTREGGSIRIEPQLTVRGSEVVPKASSVLVGAPADGVAWWNGSEGDQPAIRLAPLARPLSPEEAALVGEGPIVLAAESAARFEPEIYPRLVRRVALRSSDASLELPELPPDVLVCTVGYRHHPGGGHAVGVDWTLDPGRPVEDAPDEGATSAMARAAALTGTWPLVPLRLEGVAAARFVTEVLPAIEALDGVEVRHDGDAPAFHEVADAPVVRFGGEATKDGDWFDLLVEVSVGGEEVPFHDLFVALAAEETHLVLPSGTYFSLDRPELGELARLIDEARALHDVPSGRVRLSRFQLDLWDELGRLGVPGVQAQAWTETVRALASGDERRRPVPGSLRATLRPYQLEGFQWLAVRYEHGLGGILADDMGLGKTLQALALVCHACEEGLSDVPFLVVAPTSVIGTWQSEAARFAPGLGVATVTETEKRRGTPLSEAVAGAALVVTSYTLFRLEFAEYERLPWAGLLLDEAQFAKNAASHAYQRARRMPAPFKLAMTGTPLENSLGELWALTSITAPGLFSSRERFGDFYRVPIERHGDDERLGHLRRRIRPIMLRRTKEEVLAELPAKQEHVVELDLDPRHRRLYETYLHRERQKVLGLLDDMKANRFEIFRSLTLLRQAALHAGLVAERHDSVPSAKLELLADMAREAAEEGHRVLVFSQFTRFLQRARAAVEETGVECCYLDGRTRRREEVIRRFREGDAPVFLISLKAGGFGLNLTEADHCILLDPWWNPATEAQAVDRVHRIGQTRKVIVHRLVARDTIEEKVMALKAKKAELFKSVLGSGGFESAALSAREVRDLLE